VTANASKADVPLRRNHDFAWLWAGQTVSMAGSAVSFIGLPLSAVLLLHVDALRLGFISALELLPNVVVSPFAGHLVDRYSRHRLLLLADIGRFAILGVLPLFYFTVGLQYWMMPVAALIVGMLTSLFEISFLAFLPSLVPTHQLGSGNASLSASESAAGIAGPGLAAGLYAAGGVITLVVADAISYLASALSLLQIRRRDVRDTPTSSAPLRPRFTEMLGNYRATIMAGFSVLRADPVLRTVSVGRQTIFQLWLKDAMRGRVMGAALSSVRPRLRSRRFAPG
jgi:MFS family permease